MAKLDKFLELLVTQKGDALELVPGKPATLITGAGSKPMTKDPLTAPQMNLPCKTDATGVIQIARR